MKRDVRSWLVSIRTAVSHTGNNHISCPTTVSSKPPYVLESLTLMHSAHSSMNNPPAHTYNTTAGTTLTQMINQSGGYAPLRTNDNDKSSSYLVSCFAYEDILQMVNISTLHDRRSAICKAYFGRVRRGDHKLNKLLPDTRMVSYALRSFNELPVPMANTTRYKNALILWCLVYCQNT